MRKCPLLKSPEACLPLSWGVKATHPAAWCPPSPGPVSTIQASLRAHTILLGSRCRIGEENTNFQVSSTGLFSCRNSLTSLWPPNCHYYLFQAKSAFRSFFKSCLDGRPYYVLASLLRPARPKNAPRAKSYPSQLPFPWLASHILSKTTHNLSHHS